MPEEDKRTEDVISHAFHFQMLLSYELLLRLRAKPSLGASKDQISDKVSALLYVSEQYIQNVTIPHIQPRDIVSPDFLKYSYRSKVYKRQLEGLVRFAELLSW